MARINQGVACPTPVRVSPLEQATPEKRKFLVIPFAFTMAGAVYTESYRIPASHDFRLEMINSYYERDFFLQIRDDFLAEDLFVAPVRGSLVSGDGRLPFILPEPYTFRAGTTITIAIQDTQTGSPPPAVVEIALVGYKVFTG